MSLISVPLRLINIQLRTVLAVGGVGGLAIGLALQNLVQNLISGILIYTNATICEGLEVELQDVKLQGVVSEVGWFNTTVNGYDGTRVTVPNRRILDGTVIDKTNKRFRVCQKQLVVTFDDPSRLAELVYAVQEDLRNNPFVLQKASVLRIRTANRGHIKIYEPQFAFAGWSEFGAQFFLRAYMEKSLQGDRFLNQQSKLLIDVRLGDHDLKTRSDEFHSLSPMFY
ncbi:ynaI [Symbiodinium natans]|uniref:YnaI protein n=1 Tax=Symbiodinium natans TaxID=878477 RepID=A0A812PHL9_9DINO|nr:ynaI [Symbiodinium natans]